AGWPHRGARRKALRHWGGATRRSLTPDEGGSRWIGSLASHMGVLLVILALTGCAVAIGVPSSVPVIRSSNTTPASSPLASDNGSLGAWSAAGAGSFPRSFLIPGTDTSIRIGGS